MQELHLVGFTTDRRHLIFSSRQGAKSGSFLVPVDEELLQAVERVSAEVADDAAPDDVFEEEELVAPTADTRVDAQLSVREVQERLRAGVPVEEIAAQAGVDPAWVERFAPPIRAEQQQIVSRALDTPMERARAGQSSVVLREAVSRAMAERDVPFTAESFSAAWSSRLVGSDLWSVEFTFSHRGRRRTVAWTYHTSDGRLTTSDRLASRIGFVAGEPAGSGSSGDAGSRPSMDAGELDVPPARQQRGAGGRAPSKATTRATSEKQGSAQKKRASKNKSAAQKQSAAKKSAKKPAKKKSTAKKQSAPRTKRTTKKAATKKTSAPAKKSRPKKTAAKKTAAKKKKASAPRPSAPARREAANARKVAAAREAATRKLERATAKRVAAAKKAAQRRAAADEKAAQRRVAADEKAAVRADREAAAQRVADEQAAAAAREAAVQQRETDERADAESSAAKDRAAARAVAIAERQLAEERIAAAQETTEREAAERPAAHQPQPAEPTRTQPAQPQPAKPEPEPPETGTAEDGTPEPAGVPPERRPEQAVVRLRSSQPVAAADDDPAARVAAHRARAAERSISTAQFRSGSAVQASASSASVNGAGAAVPEGVRRIETRPDGGAARAGADGRARPDGRRPRTRQLRAR